MASVWVWSAPKIICTRSTVCQMPNVSSYALVFLLIVVVVGCDLIPLRIKLHWTKTLAAMGFEWQKNSVKMCDLCYTNTCNGEVSMKYRHETHGIGRARESLHDSQNIDPYFFARSKFHLFEPADCHEKRNSSIIDVDMKFMRGVRNLSHRM